MEGDGLSFLRTSAEAMFNDRERGVLARYVPPAIDPARVHYPASLYIILKATRLCNLRCTYCTAWREGPNQVIAFETLLDVIAQAMRLPGIRWLHIVWHGGETTLLSRKFFERAMWLQEHFRSDDRKVGHAVQTNATLIDADWARFFKASGVSVGVSLDIDAETHDRARLFRDGSGSFAATVAGIRVLQDHDVPHGILAVIDEAVIARGAGHLLATLAAQGIRTIGVLNALPPNVAGTASDQAYLPWDRFVVFLRALFAEWHDGYRDTIVIRELDSLYGIVGGARSRLCIYQGGCMGQYLTIEPDGRVSACDKYVGDETHGFGDLHDTPLQMMLNDSPALARARADAERLLTQFSGCSNYSYCRGGCPHDARLNAQHGPVGTCCGLGGLIDDMKLARETDNG